MDGEWGVGGGGLTNWGGGGGVLTDQCYGGVGGWGGEP